MKRRLNGGKPHPNSTDKTGMVFGRLTVIRRILPGRNHTYYWLCQCQCGNQTEVSSHNLNLKSPTQSCGCLQKEAAAESSSTHRDTGSREHHTWGGIIQRCHNTNSPAYPDYGGRGIIVCERWRVSYEAFLKDMDRCPKGMSLDRINNNGNYEPGNCRWTTRLVQNRNRRDNKIFTVKGITGCMSALSEHFGLPNRSVLWRIKNGWTPEAALTTPLQIRPLAWSRLTL